MRSYVAAAMCLLSAPALAGPPRYTFTEITGRPLQFWEASGIGPQGQVVGRTWNPATGLALRRGWVWQSGVLTQLDGPSGITYTEARCIDDNGVIYGGYGDSRFDPTFAKMLPVRWVGGVPIPYTNNQFVNSATIFGCSPTTGVAVGTAKPFEPNAPGWHGEYGYPVELPFANGDPVRAFRWSGDTGSVLTLELGRSGDSAEQINDAGQAAINLNGFEIGGPAIYDPRCGLTKLPTLGASLPNAGWSGFAFAINASGKIVGRSQITGGIEHPVLWDSGALTDLGVLPGFLEGEARDINDSGVIVGTLSNQNFEFGVWQTEGFVVVGGTMYNLNQSIQGPAPFVITTGLAVNSAGQILVNDAGGFGNSRFGVLTPVP